MKNLVSLVLLIFVMANVVSAQSGRKIEKSPTPTPQTEPEQNYSESSTAVKNPIYIPQKRRIEKQAKINQNAQNKKASNDDDDLITIESTLVTIPVSVFDRNGIYIKNLQQSDFQVLEEGVEQEIAVFGTSDKPFTVVLLLDTSFSADNKITEIQSAANAFVRQLKPLDRVMVVEFDGNNHVLTEFTNDKEKIYKAISKADFGYGTSLYDAVDFSLRKRLNRIEGRKAIVLFTDGVDTTSGKSSYDESVLEAEESGAIIFPIYYDTFEGTQRRLMTGIITPAGTTAAEYAVGRRYLDDLAANTGGRVFRPESTKASLTEAFEGIAEELRRQYFIGYYPSEDGSEGERRKIKVRVNRPNLVVRARDSYIVGANQQTRSSN
jgi:VWFA-related protein